MEMKKSASIRDLKRIPGVGKCMAEDFYSLGIRSVTELKGRTPENLYDSLNEMRGKVHDRCVLYVFRCAVYFATEKNHEPELLKWWNWKDREYPG